MTSTASEGRPRRVVWAICAPAALVHALFYWPRSIDDSYIYFRYAQQLVEGNGFRFNPTGVPVEGFSDLVWTLYLAGLLRLGVLDLLFAAKLTGIALFVAVVLATPALLRSTMPRPGWLAPLAAGLVAANPYLAYHAVAGLDTLWVCALLLAAGIGLMRLAESAGAAALLGAALVVLTASRPEGFGYGVGFVAAAAWLHRGTAPAGRRVAWVGLAWAVAYASVLVWRGLLFGEIFQNAAITKVIAPGALVTLERGLRYIGRFFAGQVLWTDLIVYALTAGVVLRWGTRRDRVLLLPTFYACVFSLAVNGDWMHSFRFLATTAPFLAVVLARAIALTAARWWPPGLGWRAAWEVLPARRRLLAGAGAVAGALFIVQLAWTNIATVTHETFKHLWKPPLWPVHVPGNVRRGFDTKLAGVTRWALEHVGPGQRVATGDVGFPTWAVNEEIVDILGLTDPVLCRVVPGQDAAAYRAYVGGLEPEYVVVRYHRDQPASRYDRLTLASGLLDDYEEAATVGTYGEGTRAVVYRRRGGVRSPTPGEVLARFDRAVRWNPRVGEVRAWREAYRQAHATAAAR